MSAACNKGRCGTLWDVLGDVLAVSVFNCNMFIFNMLQSFRDVRDVLSIPLLLYIIIEGV